MKEVSGPDDGSGRMRHDFRYGRLLALRMIWRDSQIISSGTVTTLLSLTEPQMVKVCPGRATEHGQTIAHRTNLAMDLSTARHGPSPT